MFDRTTLPSQKPQIFIVNVDGTGLRQLTEGDSKNYDPVFAPSGKWIAFVSDRAQGSHIYVAKSTGRRVRALTRATTAVTTPPASPVPPGRRTASTSPC